MKRFKWSTVVMIVIMMTLAGCSNPVLDYRNAEISNGTIYNKDSDIPFSGTVTNMPGELLAYSGSNLEKIFNIVNGSFSTSYGSIGVEELGLIGIVSIYRNSLCTANVREGHLDGSVKCRAPRSENVLMKLDYDKGRLSGTAIIYSPYHSEQKAVEVKFNNDQPEGTQTVYGFNSGKLVTKFEWTGINIDGNGTRYDEKTGHVLITYTLKNGRFHGIAKHFDPSTGALTATDDKWINGDLTGERKNWDINGRLISIRTYEQGYLLSTKVISDPPPPSTSKNTGDIQHQINDILSENTPTSDTKNSPDSPTRIPVESSGSLPPIPGAEPTNPCVEKLAEAHRKGAAEAGVDDAVTMDQTEEWEAACKAGK